MFVEIVPMGAVRMTKRGKFVKGPAQRYLAYKDEVGYKLRETYAEPTSAAVSVDMAFYMPIPQSWSKKKQKEMNGKPHTSKPDLDNLVKGCFDSANGIIWKDDALVCRCTAAKFYSDQPGISIKVREVF